MGVAEHNRYIHPNHAMKWEWLNILGTYILTICYEVVVGMAVHIFLIIEMYSSNKHLMNALPWHFLPLTKHQLIDLCETKSDEPKGKNFSLYKVHMPHKKPYIKMTITFPNTLIKNVFSFVE